VPAHRYSPLRIAAIYAEGNDMGLLGIDNTTRLARTRNRRRWEPLLRRRRENLEMHLAALDDERREAGRPQKTLRMADGWARDDSGSWPHLDDVLEQMNAVIDERGLRPWPDYGKPFLKDILPERSWERYSSILDFAAAPEVLEPMGRSAGFVPNLSGSVPPGFRLMESSTRHDPHSDGPWRASQLWHLDFHAYPLIYVVVAIRDIGPDDGPLNFIGRRASERAARALSYRSRSAPYRVTDETMGELVDESEVHRFVAPAGAVLFLESSSCFHFGSRRPASPRYQLQYAYLSPVRNDFSDMIRSQLEFPVNGSDPVSRRLALDRRYA
jgi:hypothetical protein